MTERLPHQIVGWNATSDFPFDMSSAFARAFEQMKQVKEPFQCMKCAKPVDYLKITRSVTEGDTNG